MVVAETYRSRAAQERAFASKAGDSSQARVALALAERLESLAEACDRLDAADVRVRSER